LHALLTHLQAILEARKEAARVELLHSQKAPPYSVVLDKRVIQPHEYSLEPNNGTSAAETKHTYSLERFRSAARKVIVARRYQKRLALLRKALRDNSIFKGSIID
jgi:hypothetical protein